MSDSAGFVFLDPIIALVEVVVDTDACALGISLHVLT